MKRVCFPGKGLLREKLAFEKKQGFPLIEGWVVGGGKEAREGAEQKRKPVEDFEKLRLEILHCRGGVQKSREGATEGKSCRY